MYRLMKSEKFTLDHLISGPLASYRQSEVTYYRQVNDALKACEMANNKTGSTRHYVLDDMGQEYFDGIWID